MQNKTQYDILFSFIFFDFFRGEVNTKCHLFLINGAVSRKNLPPVSMTPAANNGNNYQTADTLKWTWRKNLYISNSTTQSCPNKVIKNCQIEDFFHLPPVSTTPVVYLELRISPRSFKILSMHCSKYFLYRGSI